MPYIVTTKTPTRKGPDATVSGFLSPVSHHAVATLDEARDWIGNEIADAARQVGRVLPDLDQQHRWLGEHGGIVGPLPDGTVIEVQPASWDELRRVGHEDEFASSNHLIRAYNAVQEEN